MMQLLGFFPTDTTNPERKRLKTSPRFAPVEEEIRSSNPEAHASPFSVRIKQPNPVAFLFRASSWVEDRADFLVINLAAKVSHGHDRVCCVCESA